MAADHFSPVAGVAFGESERQRQHQAAGRTGNALKYISEETTSDAGDYDDVVADDD